MKNEENQKLGYFWLVIMYYDEDYFQHCSKAIFGLWLSSLILKGSHKNVDSTHQNIYLCKKIFTFACSLVGGWWSCHNYTGAANDICVWGLVETEVNMCI